MLISEKIFNTAAIVSVVLIVLRLVHIINVPFIWLITPMWMIAIIDIVVLIFMGIDHTK